MATYSKADASVHAVLEAVRDDKFESTLSARGVRVGILMARPSREGQPALKIRGYPVDAKVKIISLEDRVAGQPDARIIIDEQARDDMGEPEREALMAHELYHLELVRDQDDHVTTDDHGRPCLRIRPHDVECGMFREVYEWYGDASGEYGQREAVNRLFAQQSLSFDSERPRPRKGNGVPA